MALPYKFITGEVARAQEVNANFNYLMGLIGQLSTTGRITPPGEIALGPRGNVLLTNRNDAGSVNWKFFQITWNADWNLISSGHYIFERFVEKEPATALRIGDKGFMIFSTAKTSGNLNSQMKMRVHSWTRDVDSFLYLEQGTRIVNVDKVPESSEHMRLTTVLFERPKGIYNKISVPKGVSTMDAFDLGVPTHAIALIIRAHVTASWYSGAGMLIYQANLPQHIIKEKGMVAHATWSSHAGQRLGMRTGATGFVPLGTGANRGKFIIERTEMFEEAIVHIIGYLT